MTHILWLASTLKTESTNLRFAGCLHVCHVPNCHRAIIWIIKKVIPRGISYLFGMIVRVKVVCRKTVVVSWRFNYLSGNHLQSWATWLCSGKHPVQLLLTALIAGTFSSVPPLTWGFRDNASALQMNSASCSSHSATCLEGSLKLANHRRAPWSVLVVNFRPYREVSEIPREVHQGQHFLLSHWVVIRAALLNVLLAKTITFSWPSWTYVHLSRWTVQATWTPPPFWLDLY